jgi:hypothetical protein
MPSASYTDRHLERQIRRRYLDARIEACRKFPDITAVRASLAKANELQEHIWRQAVAAIRTEGAPLAATMLLLPARTR